jgi:hypothetical protein
MNGDHFNSAYAEFPDDPSEFGEDHPSSSIKMPFAKKESSDCARDRSGP